MADISLRQATTLVWAKQTLFGGWALTSCAGCLALSAGVVPRGCCFAIDDGGDQPIKATISLPQLAQAALVEGRPIGEKTRLNVSWEEHQRAGP
jgi:hypothetical protein